MTLRPLLAYLPWQARDSALRAVVPVIIFAALAGLPLWGLKRSQVGVVFRDPGGAQVAALETYATVLGLAILLGALILMNQTVAVDRDRQHVRFLFAHQVSPWRFYLQRFLVSALLFTAFSALMPIGFSALFTEVATLPVLKTAAMYAVLVGGLGTLAAAITHRDGLIIILVLAGASLLQQLEAVSRIPAWLARVAVSLPPFHLAGEIRQAWLRGTEVATGDVAHVLAYGVGMLIAALVIIKRAPLVR
jgi:hypothetical protein